MSSFLQGSFLLLLKYFLRHNFLPLLKSYFSKVTVLFFEYNFWLLHPTLPANPSNTYQPLENPVNPCICLLTSVDTPAKTHLLHQPMLTPPDACNPLLIAQPTPSDILRCLLTHQMPPTPIDPACRWPYGAPRVVNVALKMFTPVLMCVLNFVETDKCLTVESGVQM